MEARSFPDFVKDLILGCVEGAAAAEGIFEEVVVTEFTITADATFYSYRSEQVTPEKKFKIWMIEVGYVAGDRESTLATERMRVKVVIKGRRVIPPPKKEEGETGETGSPT